MKHEVRTFNSKGDCLYTNHHRTAEAAYEEYVDNIRIIKKHIRKGEKIIVARYNDGDLMTFEKIEG